jgi:predicted nucleic acid-binding Zn ribbon protein
MKCPYCGAEVKEGDKFCGECGKAIKREEPKRKEPSNRKMLIIYTVVAIIGVLLIVYVLISISSSTPKSTPTETPAPVTPVSTLNASVEVLKSPSAVVAGRPFEISWRVNSPIETSINHTAIHYGPESKYPPLNLESYLYISEILSGSVPNDFSTKITINNVGDYSDGVIYFRAHVIIEGISYWSEEKTIAIQSTPAASTTPTISVISYPVSVKGDANFTIRWTVLGGTPGMIHHTSVFWGFMSGGENTADYPRVSTIQTGYTPAEFSVELKAPSGGLIYFRSHAVVDDTEIYSPEYKITIY